MINTIVQSPPPPCHILKDICWIFLLYYLDCRNFHCGLGFFQMTKSFPFTISFLDLTYLIAWVLLQTISILQYFAKLI